MTKRKPRVTEPSIKTPAGSMTPRDLDPDGNFDSNEGQTQCEPVSGADVAPGRAEALPAGPRYPLSALDELEPIKATDTAAIPAAGGGLVWVLDELWAGRAKKLAAALNKSPEAFLESLLHRAWTSAPLRVRGGS